MEKNTYKYSNGNIVFHNKDLVFVNPVRLSPNILFTFMVKIEGTVKTNKITMCVRLLTSS